MPASIEKAVFGTVDGVAVHKYTITNSNGLSFTCCTFGATILSVKAPDRHGTIEEVTLCYSTLDELRRKDSRPYYGCVAGRVANRIANGKFTLNDTHYQLATNNGPNNLHGGVEGFDQKLWKAVEVCGADRLGIEFQYLSADDEERYPGNLMVSVLYSLTDMNDLVMTYTAFTDMDTHVNLTNHTYWNLSGNLRSKVYDHHLQLNCSSYLPVDAHQIPTGEYASVQDGIFDFCTERKLIDSVLAADGCGRAGIDHCFVVDGALVEINEEDQEQEQDGNSGLKTAVMMYDYDPALQLTGTGNYLRHVGTLADPLSGRQMVLHATQPGVQVYTANWLSLSAADHPHTQHNAVCLETQHFPDAANHDNFPTTVLRTGEDPYHHMAVFSFRIK